MVLSRKATSASEMGKVYFQILNGKIEIKSGPFESSLISVVTCNTGTSHSHEDLDKSVI